MFTHRNILEMIEYPQSGILSKEIIKNSKMDLGLFCMAKKTEISNHTSSREGLVLVLEGDGIFRLSGKNIKMKRGVAIYLPKEAVHSLKASKNTSFLLLLIS